MLGKVWKGSEKRHSWRGDRAVEDEVSKREVRVE